MPVAIDGSSKITVHPHPGRAVSTDWLAVQLVAAGKKDSLS